MKLNICKKFKIYTYKVKRKPAFRIFPFFRGYFENHRYIKIGVYDIVFWTKKPKKEKKKDISEIIQDCAKDNIDIQIHNFPGYSKSDNNMPNMTEIK